MACLLLVGCASNGSVQSSSDAQRGIEPFQPPSACLFTQIKAPISTEFHNAPVCTKKGEATAEYIAIPCYVPIPCVSWGGCDIDQAAKEGNISKVEYSDYEYFSVLRIYNRTTVTAYGE